MDNIKKAAIVLLSLDKEQARSVLALLPLEEKERLTLELAKTDDVSQDEQSAAITEFRDAVENRTVI